MINHPDDVLHVAACSDCQARLALRGLDVDLERIWVGISADIWGRNLGWLEVTLARLLRSPGLARALLITPSLVLSWVLASVAVLAVGVLFTHSSETPWVALLAPALAGIGIAYAYGPGVDPAFELWMSMPVSDRMVLLVRALAVLGLNTVLGLVASIFVSGAVGLTLGWLVPMAMVSALALAVATASRSANVGVAAALGGWCIVVLATSAPTGDLSAAVTREALIPVYGVATIVLAVLAIYMSGSRKMEVWTWR